MIRANQIPITLLLTIAATCCNGQTEDSTKTGASISQSTQNFGSHFLQTDNLPAFEQYVSPEDVKNGSFLLTDSDIRPTETSFLLPSQGLLEFEHAESFSTLGTPKTQQGTPKTQQGTPKTQQGHNQDTTRHSNSNRRSPTGINRHGPSGTITGTELRSSTSII